MMSSPWSPARWCFRLLPAVLAVAAASCAQPGLAPLDATAPVALAGGKAGFSSPEYPPEIPLPRTSGRFLAPATMPGEPAVAAEQPAFFIEFRPGVYRCELDRRVHVRRVSPDRKSAVLNWARRDYTLHAVQAQSGALRYEDPKSGLMFIVIVGKSLLLDTKKGKQLANECRL